MKVNDQEIIQKKNQYPNLRTTKKDERDYLTQVF